MSALTFVWWLLRTSPLSKPCVYWVSISALFILPRNPKGHPLPPLVSTLPLQVEVQGFLLSIQQCHRTAQELTAAGDGLELQDEEAQAEHGAHLLQFTGAELQTLPRKQNDPQ